MPNKLKPCPFCGDGESLDVFYCTPNSVAVTCNTCCCYGPYCVIEEEAIEAWNRRVGEVK